MTATNINIEEFINVLVSLRNKGHKMIDLDMLPDDNHPSMNKLVVTPTGAVPPQARQETQKPEIRDPQIRTDNNDIFSSFDL